MNISRVNEELDKILSVGMKIYIFLESKSYFERSLMIKILCIFF